MASIDGKHDKVGFLVVHWLMEGASDILMEGTSDDFMERMKTKHETYNTEKIEFIHQEKGRKLN